MGYSCRTFREEYLRRRSGGEAQLTGFQGRAGKNRAAAIRRARCLSGGPPRPSREFRPALGRRWPSRLVATPSEIDLSYLVDAPPSKNNGGQPGQRNRQIQ
jgi:hypothetical protein